MIINTMAAVITIAVGLLTLYFFYRKIGFHITTIVKVTRDHATPGHISKIILKNKKDKNVIIHEILGITKEKNLISIHKPENPVTLKGDDTVTLNIKPFSQLWLNSRPIEVDFSFSKVKIELDIGYKIIGCNGERSIANKEKLTQITKSVREYNGFVYGENIKYILSYVLDGNRYVAFITKFGLFCNEWPFGGTLLSGELTPRSIYDFLTNYGFHEKFSSYECMEVSELGLRKVVKK